MSSRALAVGLVLCVVVAAMGAPVPTEAAAQALFDKAKQFDASLGIVITRDILLNVRTRDELEVYNNTHGGRTIELNGVYYAYNPESIWIVSTLDENEMYGTMCHELTHAWQSTESPQQDRKLTEGFARWVEWKAMQSIDDERRANGLLHDSDPDYGGGLRFLVDLERDKGVAAVIQFAKTETKIP